MSIKRRLRAIERRTEYHKHELEVIAVNPPFEDLTGEELEQHRAAVLRVARKPKGILICFTGEGKPDPLRELLGADVYATLPRHATTIIQRSYGMK